jgi:hypothetical protein
VLSSLFFGRLQYPEIFIPLRQTLFLETEVIRSEIRVPRAWICTRMSWVKEFYEWSCIALGHGLDDRGSGFRFPAGAGNFSLHHRVQNGSGTHSASYPIGTRGSSPRGKAAGA